MVKTEIRAKTKIIRANFFHIEGPSFRMFLFVFYFLRRGTWKNYSRKMAREGEDRKRNNEQSHTSIVGWLEACGNSIDDDAFSMPRASDQDCSSRRKSDLGIENIPSFTNDPYS